MDEECFIETTPDCMEFGGGIQETKVLLKGDERTGMVCFSGGKDSTAMLLRMLELDDPINYPVNSIFFSDTTFEFPELYEYIKRVQQYLDVNYPERGLKIEMLKASKTWEDWFYGKITRGKKEGQVRGAPYTTSPCWWSREAKVIPLDREGVKYTYQYVGIAVDETKRQNKAHERMRFPLVEWGWTEQDCMEYLDYLGLGNPLYQNFNRLGCFHCIKQPTSSWYALWENYPELWKIAKHWDEENLKVADRPLSISGSLAEMEENFNAGLVPKDKRGLTCGTCNAVAFHADGTMKMEDFETDEMVEYETFYKPILQEEMQKAKDNIMWVPRSQRRKWV